MIRYRPILHIGQKTCKKNTQELVSPSELFLAAKHVKSFYRCCCACDVSMAIAVQVITCRAYTCESKSSAPCKLRCSPAWHGGRAPGFCWRQRRLGNILTIDKGLSRRQDGPKCATRSSHTDDYWQRQANTCVDKTRRLKDNIWTTITAWFRSLAVSIRQPKVFNVAILR